MKSYYIHFICHGNIDETLKGKYIGTTNVSLSDKGKMELKKLDYSMKYPGGTALFTSPLRRCKETCEIIYPNLKPIIIDQLSECNFGEWEGKTADELKKDKDFQQWIGGSNEVKPPKGESSADFTRRICRVFEDIVTGLMKTGTTESIIITHGGVIMTLLSIYGLPQAKPFEWVMDGGYGFSVRITPLLWQRDKVCEVYQKIPLIVEPEEKE